MRCSCGGNMRVTNTIVYGFVVWRRRKCVKCERKIWTAEMEDEPEDPKKIWAITNVGRA